eukprot:CAMPEP_0177686266 /NCGR_PEP_ID=MMETSP0447-20121125/33476_1 /TAXON_ID=0 /ORGANISM="Stygamoeba regulata, Strain BSH-02190019" /LENGTH=418 /DNA_ID=CAMNT_0019196375 /DNA_START=66 /DNA_END=1319 /DNA_ORIENTATION=-
MWQRLLLGGAGLSCAYSIAASTGPSSSSTLPTSPRRLLPALPALPALPSIWSAASSIPPSFSFARAHADSSLGSSRDPPVAEPSELDQLRAELNRALNDDKTAGGGASSEFADLNALTKLFSDAFIEEASSSSPPVSQPSSSRTTSPSAISASNEFHFRTSSSTPSSQPSPSFSSSSSSSSASSVTSSVSSSSPESGSKVGWVVVGLGGVLVVLHLIVGPFLLPGLRRLSAPFVAANDHLIGNVARALPGDPKRKLFVDIGSGDGCIVVDVAKETGIRGVGIENNPWLVLASRWRARREKVSERVSFKRQDLWKADLSQYDVLCFVLVPDMMEELERKLHREMKPSAYAIAGRFPLATWPHLDTHALLSAVGDIPDEPLEQGGPIDGVWVYRKPDKVQPAVADDALATPLSHTSASSQ